MVLYLLSMPPGDGSLVLRILSAAPHGVILVIVAATLVVVAVIYPRFPPRHSDFLRRTHTRVGVPAAETEARVTEAKIRPPPASVAPAVYALFVHPIKSCRGIEVERAAVLPTGLEHDRVFTCAQLRPADDIWEFITLRQFPLMATLEVELWTPDLATAPWPSDAWLVVRFPRPNAPPMHRLAARLKTGWFGTGTRGVPEREILLPMAFPSKGEAAAHRYEPGRVRIWKDTVDALNMAADPVAAAELAAYLGLAPGASLGIFRMDPSPTRRQREIFANAPRARDAGYQPTLAFQDGYPLSLMNMHSVQAVDRLTPKDIRLQGPLDIRRYRANIIVGGAPAWEEETWKRIAIRPGGDGGRTGGNNDSDCGETGSGKIGGRPVDAADEDKDGKTDGEPVGSANDKKDSEITGEPMAVIVAAGDNRDDMAMTTAVDVDGLNTTRRHHARRPSSNFFVPVKRVDGKAGVKSVTATFINGDMPEIVVKQETAATADGDENGPEPDIKHAAVTTTEGNKDSGKPTAAINPKPPATPAGGECYVSCRAVRCKLPNVHPTTGERHDAHPERALRAFRGKVDAGAPNKGVLGMQMCPRFEHPDPAVDATMRFVIERGMRIDVLEHGRHCVVKGK